MSAQQAQFLQALHGVKRALKRKADGTPLTFPPTTTPPY